MEIIAKISKGSRMDQIYIPKARTGMPAGSYVLILPLESKIKKKREQFKPFFYNIKEIEPIKLRLIEEAFKILKADNIIITGSFVNKGFSFNDIDILIIGEKINAEDIKNIEKETGIKTHVLQLTNKELLSGLSSDPLYILMLSKFIAKKRIILKTKRKINCKLLDFHLLKSKILIDNFPLLGGNEKYYLTRNMLAIELFLENRKISNEEIDKEIEKIFNIKVEKIKQNIIGNSFLKRYKETYDEIFRKILKEMKNAPKQK